MAMAKVPPLSSHPQFTLIRELAAPPCRRAVGLFVALVQKAIRKRERPYPHQPGITLFAAPVEELRIQLRLENRLKAGESLLQIIEVAYE